MGSLIVQALSTPMIASHASNVLQQWLTITATLRLGHEFGVTNAWFATRPTRYMNKKEGDNLVHEVLLLLDVYGHIYAARQLLFSAFK